MKKTNQEILDPRRDAEFVAMINQQTEYTQFISTPTIKFDASGIAGKFFKSSKDKDENGNNIWQELGESIMVHIIHANRIIVQSGRKATMQVTTTEIDQNSQIKLFDKISKEEVVSGNYKQLQTERPELDLKYSRVLYVYLDNEPYKMYLSGTKLSSLFKFLSLGNPIFNFTKLSKGKLLTTDTGEKYFELIIEKDVPVEKSLILERAEQMNNLLKEMRSSLQIITPQIDSINETQPMPFNNQF